MKISEKYVELTFIEEGFKDMIVKAFKNEDFKMSLVYASIQIFFILISAIISIKDLTRYRKVDDKLTKKLREIVGNDKIVVYMIPEKAPNAFNTGTAALYYNKGLTELMDEKEVISILLHEYGHYDKKHVQKNLTVCFTFVLAFTMFTNMVNVSKDARKDGISKVLLGLFSGILLKNGILVPMGRHFEYVADSYAAKYGYKKEFISALKKFEKYVRERLCYGHDEETCEKIMDGMSKGDVHPTFKNRIRRLLEKSIKAISAGLKPDFIINKINKNGF